MPTLLAFLLYSFTISYQAPTNTLWVSPDPQRVTYYSRVPDGNVGLLAESNPVFLELQAGDVITLTFPDTQREYVVITIKKYQALDPYNPAGMFRDELTNELYTGLDLGHKIYAGGPKRLILQTCYGGASGRIFITAYPVAQTLPTQTTRR